MRYDLYLEIVVICFIYTNVFLYHSCYSYLEKAFAKIWQVLMVSGPSPLHKGTESCIN